MSTYNWDYSLKSGRRRLCIATDQGTRYASFSPAHFGVVTTLSKFNISVCTLIILYFDILTLILLTWRIGWAPNNASRWQMGFNLTFKGLTDF